MKESSPSSALERISGNRCFDGEQQVFSHLDVMLMLLPMIGVLVIVIVWPQLVLFIPSLISPEFLK